MDDIWNLIREIDMRFTSANSVGVERAAIRAEEWRKIRGWIMAACARA